MPLAETLSEYWRTLQCDLFPWLEEELGPLGAHHRRFVTVIETVRLEAFVAQWSGLPGRPQKDRAALARAFVAKSVFTLPTTEMLIERVRSDKVLRRLCGWSRLGEVPSASTFSRAFAEFAASDLPGRVHTALARAASLRVCVGIRIEQRDDLGRPLELAHRGAVRGCLAGIQPDRVGLIFPVTAPIKGGAVGNVLKSLLKRDLIEEIVAEDETTVWRHDAEAEPEMPASETDAHPRRKGTHRRRFFLAPQGPSTHAVRVMPKPQRPRTTTSVRAPCAGAPRRPRVFPIRRNPQSVPPGPSNPSGGARHGGVAAAPGRAPRKSRSWPAAGMVEARGSFSANASAAGVRSP